LIVDGEGELHIGKINHIECGAILDLLSLSPRLSVRRPSLNIADSG